MRPRLALYLSVMDHDSPPAAEASRTARLLAAVQAGRFWFPLGLFVAALAIGLLIGMAWVARHKPRAATLANLPVEATTLASIASHAPLPAPMPGDLSALRAPASGTNGARIVDTPKLAPPSVTPSAPAPAPASTVAPALPTQSPPRLVQRGTPHYPLEALRNQQEGTVLMRVSIAPDGSVTDVRILETSHSRILDRAAVEAVQRWKFAPAMRDGLPVAGEIDVPIDFKLDQR